MDIPGALQELVATGPLAHLVTLNADGSPQVTGVWIKLVDDELLIGHTENHKKLQNIRRDPRVAVSVEYPERHPQLGLQQYVVFYGDARVEEGGAPQLIAELAKIYVGAEANVAVENLPPGFITRIRINRISGFGPTTAAQDKYNMLSDD